MIISLRNKLTKAGGMAQWLKFLLYKHEDLNTRCAVRHCRMDSNPRVHTAGQVAKIESMEDCGSASLAHMPMKKRLGLKQSRR